MARSKRVRPSPGRAGGVILIAGTKTKQTNAAPARELYTGMLFLKASSYAEFRCDLVHHLRIASASRH